MAKRRHGPLEERLRAAIDAAVGGQRGKNREVAERIGRPEPWVTEYRARRTHANLDTSLDLMRYLGWTINDLTVIENPVPADVVEALRDEETTAQVRAFLAMEPSIRALVARRQPVNVDPRQSRPTHGPTTAPTAGGRTTSSVRRRR